MAGILSQVQNSQERFIAAAGRKTTKYERNYHSTKGELSAIIYALRGVECHNLCQENRIAKEEEEEEEGYIHRLHQWVNGLEKGDGQLRSCLLYTSDAADE